MGMWHAWERTEILVHITFCWENLKGRDHLKKTTRRWDGNIKTDLKQNCGEGVRTGHIRLRIRTSVGGRLHGSKPSRSIKFREFLGYLNYQFLKTDSAPFVFTMQLIQLPQQCSEFLGSVCQNDGQSKLSYFMPGTNFWFVTTNSYNTITTNSNYSSYETGNSCMIYPEVSLVLKQHAWKKAVNVMNK
jgi:hypothetical protein